MPLASIAAGAQSNKIPHGVPATNKQSNPTSMPRTALKAAELTVDAGRREVYLKLARQWTEAAAALQMTPITGDALI
jgi:hypothetical protein